MHAKPDVSMTVGVAKANEVLMFGKKLTAQELLDCGFAKYVHFPWPSDNIIDQTMSTAKYSHHNQSSPSTLLYAHTSSLS